MNLLTIGHSNHRLDTFIRLLEQNGVTQLVDVRSAPASRYNPQFNQSHLEAVLPERAIQYVFAGKYLGGRPADPTCYKSGKLPTDDADYLHEVDYALVMQREWFRKGINRLLELADERTTAIMCSEQDPARCHRHHLIAKYLLREHPEVVVKHIYGDGTLVSAASILVSVDKPQVEQPTLF